MWYSVSSKIITLNHDSPFPKTLYNPQRKHREIQFIILEAPTARGCQTKFIKEMLLLLLSFKLRYRYEAALPTAAPGSLVERWIWCGWLQITQLHATLELYCTCLPWFTTVAQIYTVPTEWPPDGGFS